MSESGGMDIGSLVGAVRIEDQTYDLIEKIIDHVKEFVNEFEGVLGAAAIGAGIFTAAVTGMALSIEHLGEEGSVINGVENAFDKLARQVGSTGEEMSHALTEGVKGTVDDMVLMQSTMRMLSGGVKVSTEDLKMMGEVAREMGKATGTDAAHGLETLSQALLTGRTRGLSMAGIIVDIQKAEADFAKSIGTTADKLSEAGKLEAKRTGELAAMRDYLDRLGSSELSFKERIEQTKTAIEEWGEQLDKAVATSPHVLQAFDAIKDSIVNAFGGDSDALITSITGVIDRFSDNVATYGPKVIGFFVDTASAIRNLYLTVTQTWSALPGWLKEVVVDLTGAAAAVYLFREAMIATFTSEIFISSTAAVLRAADSLKAFTLAAQATYEIGGLSALFTTVFGSLTAGLAGLTTFIGPGLLLALAGGLYEVGKAVHNLYTTWQEGGSVWAFFTAKDDDNFVRRMLGISSSIEKVDASLKKLAPTIMGISAYVGPKLPEEFLAPKLGPPAEDMPTDPSKYLKDTSAALAAKNAADIKTLTEKMGLHDAWKDLNQLGDAWAKLSPVEQANETVVKRVLDSYVKLRTETGQMSPELETLFEATGTLTSKSGDLNRVMKEATYAYGETSRAAQEHLNIEKGLTKEGLIPIVETTGALIDTLSMAPPVIHTLTSSLTNEEVAAAHAAVAHDHLMSNMKALETGLKSSAESWRHLAEVTDGAAQSFAKFMAVGFQVGTMLVDDVKGILKAKDAIGLVIAAAKLATDAIALMWDALTTSPGEDVMKRVGSNFGVAITEAMGDAIAKTAKEVFGGSRAAAEIFDLDQIINAAGGLTNKNFDKLLHGLRDTFSMLETGLFSVDQATTVLDKNFKAFADHATEGNNLVSNSFLEIIKLADQAGISSKAVNDYVTAQTNTALEGLTTLLENTKDLASQAAATGIGSALWASFDELTKRGMSAAGAIKAMTPAIESLEDKLEKAGFSGGDAFESIRAMAALAADEIAGPALEGIHGAAEALLGLHNAGILNQEMFTGLADQITTTFNSMISQGKDGSAALALIAPDLQKIWELETEFGFTVDDATQQLLDQAVAAGEVGEAHKSAQEKAVDAMNKAADAMIRVGDILDNVFNQAGNAAETFAKRTTDAIDSIPTNVGVNVTQNNAEAPNAVHEAEGGSGTVTKPTWFLAGEAGAEDFQFSGANKKLPLGGDTKVLEGKVDDLIRAVSYTLPRAIQVKANNGITNR